MEKKSFSRFIYKNEILIVAWMIFCLCSSGPKKVTHRFFALDTVVDVTLYSNSVQAHSDLDSLERFVMTLDTQLSISLPKSDVYRINHRKDSLPVTSNTLTTILTVCREEWKRSNGLFDVTVEPLKFLYGLESRQEKHHVPSIAELADARARIGFDKIVFVNDSVLLLPSNVHIDLGGIAKGYVLEQTRRFLVGKGYENFLINTGGDLIAHGAKPSGDPWIIGIRHPREDQSLIARLKVKNSAVFTSGDYERYFIENNTRYHHLFNPKTGLPGRYNQSVTVVGEEALAVDAAVKTAFLMPAPDALSYLDSRHMQGLLVDSAGAIWASKGLGEILTSDSIAVIRFR